ncbi:uncharacterized protein LOC114537686 [Dendronephthya gigantea]|uniref:uncharacterized protein LOC114537686 n=1 Tax=Dendronephthya gigantea TaxID=151771 RepID=UPI001069DF4C|nr:uncharacterized protein LOC114537686 [Dendronephthya gigantea]
MINEVLRKHFQFNTFKMLDRIISTLLSLFSALVMGTPRISREVNDSRSALEQDGQLNDTIYSEYALFGEENVPSSRDYIELGYEIESRRSYRQSFLRSLKATLTIISAVVPLVIFGVILIYFDLRTIDLCFQWMIKSNNTLSFDVQRIRLLGNGIDAVVVNVLFPMFLALLFGWKKFKSQYSLTVLVGLLTALLYTLYLSFLLLYRVYDTSLWYRVPGNVLFAIAVIMESAIVVSKIRQCDPGISYPNLQIFIIVAFPFFLAFAVAMFYRYALVYWFISLENVLFRFIVAITAPTLTLVLAVICRRMALRCSSQVVRPERSFALVYFIPATGIVVYRIMQANFKNIWLFVGLCIVSGVSRVLKVATVNIRGKVWARIIEISNKICCFTLHRSHEDTPHHRRLKADMNIQNILFDSNSLILSQAYIVLYHITSFEMSAWTVLKSFFILTAIGLGIEIVFIFLATFIQIHWHNIPIARVWSKNWRRHVFGNGVVVIGVVTYFTKPLITVFQNRFQNNPVFGAKNYTIRNCTPSYKNWY